MTPDLNKLQRDVERDMTLLTALPRELPSATAQEQLQAAVLAAAREGTRRRRWLTVARTLTGAAAAILLVLGLLSTNTPNGTVEDMATADALLRDWGLAYDESAERVGELIEGGWVDERFGDTEDPEAELDALLNSLDTSLDDLGAL